MLSGITTRAVILILGFVFVTFAFVVILYALTADADRPALLVRISAAVPAVLAAIPAIMAMLFAKDARASSAQSAERLNGGLDARIKKSAKSAAKEALAERDTKRVKEAEDHPLTEQ